MGVIRSRNPLARRYYRLRRNKKKANVAKTAIGPSLARCIYGVLKHRCPYREDRWGRAAKSAHWSRKPVLALGPPRPNSDKDLLPYNLLGNP